MLVGDIIRQTAARDPDKIGMVYGDARYSWRQVDQRATRMANGLLGLGLQKGERVAILSRNCNQYIEFYFAAAKAGLVSVPLNSWLLPSELSYLIDDAGASAIIVDENYTDKAAKLHVADPKHYIGLGAARPLHRQPHPRFPKRVVPVASNASTKAARPRTPRRSGRRCAAVPSP